MCLVETEGVLGVFFEAEGGRHSVCGRLETRLAMGHDVGCPADEAFENWAARSTECALWLRRPG